MRFVFCFLLVFVHLAAVAADLTQLMSQTRENPQAQLELLLKKPATTATDFYLLAYSYYSLNSKEAALEQSNKALTLKPEPELTARILLMQALVYGVHYRDTAQAIEKLKQAQASLPEQASKTIQQLRMDILESFAQAYNQQGQTEQAMQAALLSFNLATDTADKQRQLDALIMLGRLHLQNNDLAKAYQQFDPALTLARELDDQKAVAAISLRLGMAYQKLGQNELALQYFQKAADRYAALDIKQSQINALINIGDIQLVLQQLELAKKTYADALKLALAIDDPYMIVSAYVSQSELAVEEHNLDLAQQLLTKAHQLSSQLAAKSVQSETALFLAAVFIQKKNYRSARQLLDEVSPELDNAAIYIRQKHQALSAELAALEQNWQQAYQLEKSANQLEIAGLNDSSKVQLDSLKSSLELQIQQEELQKQNIAKQSQLKQWLLASLVMLLIAVTALIVLFNKQKKNLTSTMQQPQWSSFTELLQHSHKARPAGHLLVFLLDLKAPLLRKGLQQVNTELAAFKAELDQALFWAEQDQEFWLYCETEQAAVKLQQKLQKLLPQAYTLHSALLPLHNLLSEQMHAKDPDALRELVWYSLYLAQQQGIEGKLQLNFHSNQARPCAWQAENLRQDLFNAISLGLLELTVNGVSLTEKLKQQLVQL